VAYDAFNIQHITLYAGGDNKNSPNPMGGSVRDAAVCKAVGTSALAMLGKITEAVATELATLKKVLLLDVWPDSISS